MIKHVETVVWLDDQGEKIACVEKVKVMQENLLEIQGLMQDAFEDALLMGCQETQFKNVLTQMILAMNNPYSLSKINEVN
jgi:hypothetical protein